MNFFNFYQKRLHFDRLLLNKLRPLITTMADKCTFKISAGNTGVDFNSDIDQTASSSSSMECMFNPLTARKRKGLDTSVVTEEERNGHPFQGHVENESRTDATQNVDSSSVNNHIPNRTSKWTSDVFKILRISLDMDAIYSPLRILQDNECEKTKIKPLLVWLKDIMIKRKYLTSFRVLEKKVQKVLNHFRFYKPLDRIDVSDIVEIKDNLADILLENEATEESDVATKLPFLQPVDQFEKYWNHVANMFNCKAGDFTASLKYMISLRENGQTILDSLYGVLFLDFIGMFGVHGVSFPSIPPCTLYIQGEEVKSSPDIVLMDRLNIHKNTPEAFSIKMLTVVKVKKKPQDKYHPTPAKLKKDTKTEREVGIDDKVIGQHCGDLLLFQSMSASDEGIMGMIVDGTQITFTYFICNKEQLYAIENNDYDYHGDSPSVLFSKSYNYLTASDREELMETLIILGVQQNSS